MNTINKIDYEATNTKFTRISNDIINNPNLTLKAKGLALMFLIHQDGYIVYDTMIQKMNKDGRKSVKAGINELIENGHLEIIPASKEIKDLAKVPYLECVYIFHEEPFKVSKKTTLNEGVQKEHLEKSVKVSKRNTLSVQKDNLKVSKKTTLRCPKGTTNNTITIQSQNNHKTINCLPVSNEEEETNENKNRIVLFNNISKLISGKEKLINKRLDELNLENYKYGDYLRTFKEERKTINFIIGKNESTEDWKINSIFSCLRKHVNKYKKTIVKINQEIKNKLNGVANLEDGSIGNFSIIAQRSTKDKIQEYLGYLSILETKNTVIDGYDKKQLQNLWNCKIAFERLINSNFYIAQK